MVYVRRQYLSDTGYIGENHVRGLHMRCQSDIRGLTSDCRSIRSVNRACKSAAFVSGLLPYGLIVEAVIESAMSTWFGLLLYEIASLAPEGHYTVSHPN